MAGKDIKEMNLKELNDELKRCVDALEADLRYLGVIK